MIFELTAEKRKVLLLLALVFNIASLFFVFMYSRDSHTIPVVASDSVQQEVPLASRDYATSTVPVQKELTEENKASSTKESTLLTSTTTESGIPSQISLLFVGDVMLSRAIGRKMEKENNWTFPFMKSSSTLRDADLTFGNLENPISAKGEDRGGLYSFRADPRVMEGLVFAGFDVLSVANNHIWDYGKDAYEDTLTLLDENGILHVGSGKNFSEAHTSIVKEVKGVRIAFLGYTNLLPSFLGKITSQPSVASYSVRQVQKDIGEAKKIADMVVVSFHFGEEYSLRHNKDQETYAHLAIDEGASLVIGHHPHVVQEVEKYKDGYIFYSLGNFIFDQNFSKETEKGLAVKVFVDSGKKTIERIEEYPVSFNAFYQPFIMTP